MMKAWHRDGFALPGALLAMVLVAALITGGVYAVNQNQEGTQGMRAADAAFFAAERGIEETLGSKDRDFFELGVAVGDIMTLPPETMEVGRLKTRHTVQVRRLATRMFLIESQGEVIESGRYSGAGRRVATLARTAYFYLPRDRAVMTLAPMTVRGKSTISGKDTIPAGWTDCTDDGTRTGILTDEDADITIPASNPNAGVYGDPPVEEDPTLDDSDFSDYGDMTYDELAAMADINLPPGNYNNIAPQDDGTNCLYSNTNWGDPRDPTSPCHYYFPIIYVNGNLDLQTGYGQGILVVEGDLKIAGNFEFAGIIFVKGDFFTVGTGNKIIGSINIKGTSTGSDVSTDGASGAGDTRIIRSTCAIERAHRYNQRLSRAFPPGHRSYVDMSSIGMGPM